MLCSIATRLEESQVERIRRLEKDLGLLLVAFACRSIDPAREERLRKIEAELGPSLLVQPARPSEEQLARIQQLEGDMGLSLVGVQA